MLPTTFVQNVDKRELNFKKETGIWKDESNKLDTDTRLRKQKNYLLYRESREMFNELGSIAAVDFSSSFPCCRSISYLIFSLRLFTVRFLFIR